MFGSYMVNFFVDLLVRPPPDVSCIPLPPPPPEQMSNVPSRPTSRQSRLSATSKVMTKVASPILIQDPKLSTSLKSNIQSSPQKQSLEQRMAQMFNLGGTSDSVQPDSSPYLPTKSNSLLPNSDVTCDSLGN